MSGPMSARIIALHSMCHPGRPGPQGLSQVGSPGLAPFHSTKSAGLRLAALTATRSPARLSSWCARRCQAHADFYMTVVALCTFVTYLVVITWQVCT